MSSAGAVNCGQSEKTGRKASDSVVAELLRGGTLEVNPANGGGGGASSLVTGRRAAFAKARSTRRFAFLRSWRRPPTTSWHLLMVVPTTTTTFAQRILSVAANGRPCPATKNLIERPTTSERNVMETEEQSIASPAPVRHKGTVISWNLARGYGWVKCDELFIQVFLHVSDIARVPGVGAPISFAMGTDREGRRKAVDAQFLGDQR